MSSTEQFATESYSQGTSQWMIEFWVFEMLSASIARKEEGIPNNGSIECANLAWKSITLQDLLENSNKENKCELLPAATRETLHKSPKTSHNWIDHDMEQDKKVESERTKRQRSQYQSLHCLKTKKHAALQNEKQAHKWMKHHKSM